MSYPRDRLVVLDWGVAGFYSVSGWIVERAMRYS
jgi:hypothetical protein